MGVIPFARAPSPRRRTTRAPTQKPSWKKLNTALQLVCWSVSFLFCRVSLLAGLLASRSSFGLVCLGGFRVAFFPGEGRRPQNRPFFLTGVPLCRLQCWADITSEVTPEHGLVDKVLFVLSPPVTTCGRCTRWQVLNVQTGAFFLVCGFLTTLRRHCGQLLRRRCFLFFFHIVGFLSWFEQVGSWNYLLLRGIRFLCSGIRLHGGTSGSVYSRQCYGDTSANERTIDGTDDDLNDCSNGGASHYKRSQLHGCAQGLAHI